MPYEARKQAAANAYTGLCLVVHDDLELRLRIAGLVRRAVPALDAHCVGGSGLENLSVDQLRSCGAVLIIVEFMQKNAGLRINAQPYARLRARAPLMPIFVFARHGNERLAARAMKAGAVDYWPIHSVDVAELAAALRPYVQPGPGAENAPKTGAAATDAADYPEVAGYRLLKTIAHTSAFDGGILARNSDLGQHGGVLAAQNLQGAGERLGQRGRQRFARECEILLELEPPLDRRRHRFRHHARVSVPRARILSLRQHARAAQESGKREATRSTTRGRSPRRIARWRHAAGVVHRDLEAFEPHAHDRQPAGAHRFRLGSARRSSGMICRGRT